MHSVNPKCELKIKKRFLMVIHSTYNVIGWSRM